MYICGHRTEVGRHFSGFTAEDRIRSSSARAVLFGLQRMVVYQCRGHRAVTRMLLDFLEAYAAFQCKRDRRMPQRVGTESGAVEARVDQSVLDDSGNASGTQPAVPAAVGKRAEDRIFLSYRSDDAPVFVQYLPDPVGKHYEFGLVFPALSLHRKDP